MDKINKLYNWWANDYNPLDGRLRFIFYGLLLYTGLYELFFRIPRLLNQCPEILYKQSGVMAYIPYIAQSPEVMLQTVKFIIVPLFIFWIFAAFGFLGRISMFLTGIGVFLVWGAYQNCAGTGHTWHLPMYTLLILGFLAKPDKWSIDYYLSKKFKWYPFKVSEVDRTSGFARKLVLIFAMYTLFAGGLAKLFYGGLAWLNGSSLLYYLSHFNNPKWMIGNIMNETVLTFSFITILLSIWTVLLELGSFSAIFNKKIRLFIIVNAWAFHIGIYFLMLPKYFPQMVCYLLIINWSLFNFSYIRSIFKGSILSPFLQKNNSIPKNEAGKPIKVMTIFVSSLVGLLLVFSIAFKIESFPLTYIPMYSTYLSEEKFDSHPWDEFESQNGLYRILDECSVEQYPWFLKFYLPRRIQVEAVSSDGTRFDITDKVYESIRNNWPVWGKRLTESIIQDYHVLGTIENLHLHPQGSFSEAGKLMNGITDYTSTYFDFNEVDRFELNYVFDSDEFFTIYSVHQESIKQ